MKSQNVNGWMKFLKRKWVNLHTCSVHRTMYILVACFWCQKCDCKTYKTAISIPSYTCFIQLIFFCVSFRIHYSLFACTVCICMLPAANSTDCSERSKYNSFDLKYSPILWIILFTHCALFCSIIFLNAHPMKIEERNREIKWDSRLSLPAIIFCCRCFIENQTFEHCNICTLWEYIYSSSFPPLSLCLYTAILSLLTLQISMQ